MEKQLHINEPKIKAYLHHAYVLSVIQGCEDFEPWFNSSYIQLYVEENSGLNFYDYDFSHYHIPFLKKHSLPRDIVFNKEEHIIDFTIQWLKEGYYVYHFVDEYYIDTKFSYHRQHFIHEMLLYGYNDEEELFYTSGFDSRGIYTKQTVSYKQFEEAFQKADISVDYQNVVYLWQANDDCRYQFDVDFVKEQLSDYMLSKNTSMRHRMFYPAKQSVFGLDVYDYLVHHIRQGVHKDEFINVVFFHLLWEHKVNMTERIKYMERLDYLPDTGLSLEFKEIEQAFYDIRNQSLESSLSGHKSILYQSIKVIEEMKMKEYMILKQVIQALP
jgi:hypothetical protein